MKPILLCLALSALLGSSTFAEETAGEKAASTGRDVKRSVKKGAHRTQEAVCMKGDVECAAEKAKHRATEGKDYVEDKAKDAKDTMD
jgi:hypothetical protein